MAKGVVVSLVSVLVLCIAVSTLAETVKREAFDSTLQLAVVNEANLVREVSAVKYMMHEANTEETKSFTRSLGQLFNLKRSEHQDRNCFPNTIEVKNPLETCCWYETSTCCNKPIADYVIPYIKGNLTKLQEEIGLGDQCYFAVADLVCMICSPNTADFITSPKLGNGVQIHLCDSFCEKIYSACMKDIPKIPGMPTTVSNGEQFCAELFKDAKAKGNIVFDPKEEKSCFDGVPLSEVEKGYCLPGQKKPKEDEVGPIGIIAIVLSVLLVIVAVTVGVSAAFYFLYWKKRKQERQQMEITLTSFDE